MYQLFSRPKSVGVCPRSQWPTDYTHWIYYLIGNTNRMCIELGRRGYRSGEPDGIQREQSVVWKKVFSQLWSERTTKNQIAKHLNLPLDEF